MNRLLVDANLLCLLVAGYAAPSAIGQHKRLKAYDSSDFTEVAGIVSGFDQIITCAHILTETSNLLSYTNPNQKGILLKGLSVLLRDMDELQPSSVDACGHSSFLRLGLTDAVMLTMEISGAPLLTVDLDLALAAERDGRKALNYNWYRDGVYS